MPRISACRARAILGRAANGLADHDLEALINDLYGLADLAIECYSLQAGLNESEATIQELDERMQDRREALILAGFSVGAAARAVDGHYRKNSTEDR